MRRSNILRECSIVKTLKTRWVLTRGPLESPLKTFKDKKETKGKWFSNALIEPGCDTRRFMENRLERNFISFEM